jgi:ATP-binding cassette subfamily B protein
VAAIERADQIIVLDEGAVVEKGTHDELIAKSGLYADIYQAQLEEELLR